MKFLEKEIGKITHYFKKIGVAVAQLSKSMKEGDTIHIKGATTDFKQKVKSMQVEHKELTEAKPKDDVGLKVKDAVREHDVIYKVEEE